MVHQCSISPNDPEITMNNAPSRARDLTQNKDLVESCFVCIEIQETSSISKKPL